MGWQAVTLTYRARSPLLLGDHKLGFIQRTRYFIPGWTLWGALTATLARAVFAEADGAHYAAVGRWVAEQLLTSYAYLLVDGKSTAPQFKDGQWTYGPLPAAQFEARFVTSLGQTAIAPESFTAQTNTLHETEALSPYDLATGEPARWQFTLYRQVSESAKERVSERLMALSLDDLSAALKMLTVGADRSTGLGWLEQEQVSAWQPVEGDAWPVPVDWDVGQRILRAHVRAEGLPGDKVHGRVEAIPWRWWRNTPDADSKSWGPGQEQRAQCFYPPGSVVVSAWEPVIGPYGIWQRRS